MFSVNELIRATKGKLLSGKIGLIIKGISTDSRSIKPGEAFLALEGDNFDGHSFIADAIAKGAPAVIFQRDVAPPFFKDTAFIKVRNSTRALADIARFHRQRFSIPVIAVTGSNGKTTTKEMIYWVLSKKYRVLKNEGTKNNHIGVPQALLGLDKRHDCAVLELGTNHYGEIRNLAEIVLPDIAIITNIGPTHLEFLENLEGVCREKCSLLGHLGKPALGFINADDDLLRQKISDAHSPVSLFSFGVNFQSDFWATDILACGRRIEFLVNKKQRFSLDTLGRANVYNALAAIGVARLFGMEYRAIAEQLSTFKFPNGRLNIIQVNNITFIDDTYNSNPSSLMQALEVLKSYKAKGRKIFVMGDMLELGEESKAMHAQIGEEASAVCQTFVSVGSLSRLAAHRARRKGLKSIFSCQNSSQARDLLFKTIVVRPEDVILLKGSRKMRLEEVLKT